MPWKGLWDSGTTYDHFDVVRASNDAIYSSNAGSNTGNNPVSSPSDWNLVLYGVPKGGATSDYLKKNSATDYDASFDSIFRVDAPYSNVKLLLGVSGTTITDFETTPKTITTSGTVTTSSSVKKFSNNSMDLRSGYLTFTQTDDFAANALTTNAFTWETWVYCTTLNASDNIIMDNRGSASTPGVAFFVNSSGKLCFFDGAIKGNAGTTFTANAWHHVALSAEKGLAGIFLDGVLTATAAIGNAARGTTGSTKVARRNDGTLGLAGYYDQFRVTQGVARYKTTFTPSFGAPGAAFPTS